MNDDAIGLKHLTLELAFRTYATDQMKVRHYRVLSALHRLEVESRRRGEIYGPPMTDADRLLLTKIEHEITEEIRTGLVCGVLLARGFIPGSLSVSLIPYLWWKQATFNIAESSAEANGSKLVGIAISRASIPLPTPVGSGLPGRPTSMHLLLTEMKERHRRGDLHTSLAVEARHLSSWLEGAHPGSPRATPKTVENTIRNDFRTLTHEQKQPPK